MYMCKSACLKRLLSKNLMVKRNQSIHFALAKYTAFTLTQNGKNALFVHPLVIMRQQSFLVACTRLYKPLCRSVRWSVGWSVGRSLFTKHATYGDWPCFHCKNFENMHCLGIEPRSQEWESWMIPLHQQCFLTWVKNVKTDRKKLILCIVKLRGI